MKRNAFRIYNECSEKVNRETRQCIWFCRLSCASILNRVGLKSIDSVLRSGLSNARQEKLEWIKANAIQKRQDKFIKCITDNIQTKILGTYDAPSQWQLPLAEDGSMESLSMDNNRTRAIINKFELIIEVSFSDSDGNKRRLLRCFTRYRAALTILRKNTDYTPDEINAFQEHIDAWFCEWVSVYGKEGCTNYTHMLSSFHVMRYMQEMEVPIQILAAGMGSP